MYLMDYTEEALRHVMLFEIFMYGKRADQEPLEWADISVTCSTLCHVTFTIESTLSSAMTQKPVHVSAAQIRRFAL